MQIFKFLVLTLASALYTGVAATPVIKDNEVAKRQVLMNRGFLRTFTILGHITLRVLASGLPWTSCCVLNVHVS
ncbi:hypothetical protein B0H11DRAFT_2275469 [Mycena galericulata]|nr:hypothetical protein B0H11DRAFT_2282597 [Mycena galericulata]KAJ7501177.1 hypothetical protein B0H11DRAFT_2275469 [Mycena galericulata]